MSIQTIPKIYEKEYELFNLVHKLYDKIGDEPNNSIHIIDNSDEFKANEEDFTYRLYLKGKYCIDVSQTRNYELAEGETHDDYDEFEMFWDYYVWDEGDGFEDLTIDEAIKLIKHLL